MVSPILFLFPILSLLGQSLSYDSGYWTPEPTTTAWWTPTTTSYWSYYTPTTAYTTCYTQENVVVTVTSYLPCPVTSTIVYWECCPQCENNCQTPPPAPAPTSPETPGYIGTTTVTSYTTTTPAPLTTVTSNGLVIVMVASSPVPGPTPSVVYQVVNEGGQEGAASYLWSMGITLAAIATIMILL